MQDSLSKAAVKAIDKFLEEFEGCHIKPNVIFMPQAFRDAIKVNYPDLIRGKYYINGNNLIRIVLTKDEEGIIGVSFSLDTEYVMEYQ